MILSLTLTDEQAELIQTFRRMGGFVSDEDVVLTGLWHLVKHYRLDVHPDVCGVSAPKAVRTRTPKAMAEGGAA